MTRKSLARRYQSILLLAVAFLLTLCPGALAQVDVSAQLQGTITDPSGAAIPGAQLEATSQQTTAQFSTTSDERGSYLFRSIPAGTYTLTCEVAGFKKYTASGIVIQPQKVFTLNVALVIGASTQTIEVKAQAAMVDTSNATLQTSYQEKILPAIPVMGRDPRETLELLVPGAVAAGQGPSSSVSVTSFNGIAGSANNYRVDGSNVIDYFHAVSATMPAVENLAEFNVVSSAPDASYGQAAGGQISAILKSGTDRLHGEGWGYFQNGAWNANSWQNNWLGVGRPRQSQQWWGGNVGGPVILPKIYNGKDKTFFFTSFERTSTNTTTPTTGQTITNAERNGDFTNSPDGIPVINGVPTPIIDPATFSTLGKTIMTRTDIMPQPTSGLDTFTWSPATANTTNNLLVKIDQNISSKHRLFGSVWSTRNTQSGPNLFFKFAYSASWTHYPNKNQNFVYPLDTTVWTFNDTYTISPSMVNNFILGITRFATSLTDPAAAHPLFGDAEVGIAAVGDLNSPDIDRISTPRVMGEDIYQGYQNIITNNFTNITDNLIITKGRHTFKAGFVYRHYREIFIQAYNSGLQLAFNDGQQSFGGTGNGIADMMLGLAATPNQLSTENLNNLYPAREAYFQDSIKLSPRLNIMLGVRWEPYLGVREADGLITAFRPGQQSTIFPLAPVGLVAAGDAGISKSTNPSRLWEFGPHISLAWDVFGNGKAALRGGYALMTEYQYMQIFNQFGTSFPYGFTYSPGTNSLANLADPYAQYEASTGSKPFPFKSPTASSPSNATLKFPLPLNMTIIDKNYGNAEVHEWNATFEYQPVNTLMLSFAYVGTRGTHLQENHDQDWPAFVPGASANKTANINSRRPYFAQGFQTITTYFTDFNSMYNALQVGFTKRYSRGLTFQGNYTLSSTAQEQNGPRYYGNLGLDYYSPGNISTFALAFSYDVPMPTISSKLVRSLVGGWTVGGSINASTGQYGSVSDTNCAQFNYGSASCKGVFLGGSPYATNLKQAQLAGGAQIGVSWLNPNKFLRADQVQVNGVTMTSPNLGQTLFLGNAITGVYKGPAMFMPNGSLSKNFRLTESLSLNWRIEATNVLNHTVLTMPANTTVGPDMTHFGAITTAMPPRQVQMSAHFIF
jgi:Carboxypeptidase regulatory-like domain